MKTINEFLQERLSSRAPGKINAPTFAYKCFYDKDPEPPISGRESSHKQKIYNGIGIDIHIPDKVLDDLNVIKQIELRSSCEGDSPRHLTFLIFRPSNRNKQTAAKMVAKLNKFKDIKACWDTGNEGVARIVITTNIWYKKNPRLFNMWWLGLPEKIKQSI